MVMGQPMQQNETVGVFLRFLNEKLNEFRSALATFIRTMTLEDRNSKSKTAGELLVRVETLRSTLSTNDLPHWVPTLEQALRAYQKNPNHPDAGFSVMKGIMSVYHQIQNQKWDMADFSAAGAIEFTAIYEDVYAGSGIRELFDTLIEQLQWIIDSGLIDSNGAIKQLERLLATLRKNATADIFSRQGAWQFTKIFVKNFSWEILEKVPILEQATKALRKTMEELDIKFSHVRDEVTNRLTNAAKPDQPTLPKKEFPLPAPSHEDREILADSKLADAHQSENS